MALSDLAVFSEYVYSIATEVCDQQVDLFNTASRGAITLTNSAHTGDFNDEAYYQKIVGLVRRRNVYADDDVASKKVAHIVDTMVKVAAGTPPVDISPAFWKWITRTPEEPAAIIGKQLALDTMQDMLNAAVGCGVAALSSNAEITYDETATMDTTKTLTLKAQNAAAALFGDASSNIAAWIMHSTPMHDFWGNSIAGTNGTQFLFRFETLSVVADAWGRVFIVSDVPALVGSSKFFTLGLQPNAIRVDRNADFNDNVSTLNGGENIRRTYQAEWSYNIGVLGYTWNKASGGHSPTNAALFTSSNWDLISTSNKTTAGVLLITA